MSHLRFQVEAFHEAFGVPVGDVPRVPGDDRVRLRLELIREEFLELVEACGYSLTDFYGLMKHGAVDMVSVADALADLDYVIEGTRLELGIDGDPIADEVHRSNMAKLGGEKRADGKILKPAGWTAPDIAGELRKQGWIE